MGCASSKQRRCRHCKTPYSPVPRSYSMHVVHPPQEKGDSYHVVALTSATLGSVPLTSSADIKRNINAALDIVAAIGDNYDGDNCTPDCPAGNGVAGIDKELKSKEFSLGLIEAKSWSNMIQEKIPKVIPKTPVRTPPGEPETINTWELMAGLEEDDGYFNLNNPPHRFRSFSFDISGDPNRIAESPKLLSNNQIKPIWVQLAEEEEENPSSITTEFDPQVISTFRKSLSQLSPDHPFYLKPSSSDEEDKPEPESESKQTKPKVTVYLTSLRGVRKTYEDCCHVRVILKGLGLKVDERDVSMHSGFKEELKELLGDGLDGTGLGLPRVFVGTKYIGGADEIRRLHEEGDLETVLRGCERAEVGGGVGGACGACGDIRFVPCDTCSGSCKIYYEEYEEEEEEVNSGSDYGFQRCPDCNENGLIRCPICC